MSLREKVGTAMLVAVLTVLLPACKPAVEPEKAPSSHIKITPSKPSRTSRVTPVETKEGATEAEVGLAFYPGATVNQSSYLRDKKGFISGAELVTHDGYVDVVNFYRLKYQSKQPKELVHKAEQEQSTALNWQDAHGNYTIVVRQDMKAKQTVITLAKTSKS
ncbi:MAG: hypothetical protein ABFE08_20435 [Armatimonadia bacterium]